MWFEGESVEENANLVVRLLIRRPECLGPALRGEGGGLLKGMTGSIVMSLQIVAARDQDTRVFLRAVTGMKDDDRGDYLQQRYARFNLLMYHGVVLNCYRSYSSYMRELNGWRFGLVVTRWLQST